MSEKKRIVFLVFGFLGIFSISAYVFYFSSLTGLQTNRQTYRSQASSGGGSDISLEPYCKDGYYNIPGEETCSRAPNCGGKDYDEVAKLPPPNPQKCMGDGDAQRGSLGCGGYVPVCCYEVARTGDFTKCVGYWERLWCSQSLCEEAKSRGASDSQCGGSCQCGHASKNYCKGNAPVIPLSQRLGLSKPQNTQAVPTNTPRQQPTNIPSTLPPTATPQPASPTNTAQQPLITPTRTPQNPTTRPTEPFVFPTSPAINFDPSPTSTPVPIITTNFPTPTQSAVEPVNIFENMSNNLVPDISRDEVVEQTVTTLQTYTAEPLAVPEAGVKRVLDVDKQIEQTVNTFFEEVVFRIRVFLIQIGR